MRRNDSFIAASFALCALAAAGCGGGIGPGDYVIFRVAFEHTKESGAGCNTTGNPIEESSSIRTSTSFHLYGGANEKLYLEVNDPQGSTLEGGESGDGYAFTGKSEVTNALAGQSVTLTTKIDVTMTLDGSIATGTHKHAQTCAGNGCGAQEGTCTQTTNFVGSIIEGATLEHSL
jgi:hypothetical protein